MAAVLGRPTPMKHERLPTSERAATIVWSSPLEAGARSSGTAATARAPGRNLAASVEQRCRESLRCVAGLEDLGHLEAGAGEVAGQQSGARVPIARFTGVKDLPVTGRGPGARAVTDMQAPIALGVVEELPEQVVDSLARRGGKRAMELRS